MRQRHTYLGGEVGSAYGQVVQRKRADVLISNSLTPIKGSRRPSCVR